MSNKPQMKRTIGISLVHQRDRTIIFYAPEWAAQAVSEFGGLDSFGVEKWRLIVDARYDFPEVVSYIENYDAPKE